MSFSITFYYCYPAILGRDGILNRKLRLVRDNQKYRYGVICVVLPRILSNRFKNGCHKFGNFYSVKLPEIFIKVKVVNIVT